MVTTSLDQGESHPKLFRLIDANLNRLREGIRVCEDIQRYLHDNKELSCRFKKLRHTCRIKDQDKYLKYRDINGDVSKQTIDSESKRENLYQIQIANMKRAQESSRVLEESLKLIDPKEAQKFKEIRYELYDLEISSFHPAPHK